MQVETQGFQIGYQTTVLFGLVEPQATRNCFSIFGYEGIVADYSTAGNRGHSVFLIVSYGITGNDVGSGQGDSCEQTG